MIPIFVGGTGRSGTTILLELLGRHSQITISNPSEIQILTDKDGLIDLYENENLDNFEKYIYKIKQNKQNFYYSFIHLFEDKKIKYIINELKNNFNKNKQEAIIKFYESLFEKENKYLGDSTTNSITNAYRINNIFSNSKFIHVFRDGRDSAYSDYEIMKNNKFYTHIKTPNDALDFWHKKIISSFESLTLINQDKYINIRLENLVTSNKEFEKNKITKFLSIENEDKMDLFFNNEIVKEKMSVGKWKNIECAKEFDKKYDEILNNLKHKNIFIEKYY
jgi:hypothetical protein